MQTTRTLLDPKAEGLGQRAFIPRGDSGGRCVGVFTPAALVNRSQLERRLAQTAPAISGCVCTEWKLMEQDGGALRGPCVRSYMTPDAVGPENWQG
jgi:hypothetical protein